MQSPEWLSWLKCHCLCQKIVGSVQVGVNEGGNQWIFLPSLSFSFSLALTSPLPLSKKNILR